MNPETDFLFSEDHNDAYHGASALLVGAKYQLLREGGRSPVSVAPFFSFRTPTNEYGSTRYLAPGWSDPQYEFGLALCRFFNLDWFPGIYSYMSSSYLHIQPTGNAAIPGYGLFSWEVGGSPIRRLKQFSVRAFLSHMQATHGMVAADAPDFINQLGGVAGTHLLAHVDTSLKKRRTSYGLGVNYQLTPHALVFIAFSHELADKYVRMTTEVKGLQTGVTIQFD